MHIEKHISVLLFQHDCVIVPHFGAFVINAKPASLNKVNKKLSPPFGKISFNNNINHNDGLLVNHISQSEKIDYKSAVNQVQTEVDGWKKQLNDNHLVHILHIGVLSLSENKKFVFQQDESVNYLAEAYGLSPFQAISIPKEKAETPIIPINSEKRKNTWKYAAAAVLILSIGGWWSLHNNYLKDVNYSTLMPWVEKTPQYYVERNKTEHLAPIISIKKNQDTFVDATITIAGKKLNIYQPDKTKVAKNMSEATQGKYCVIGGCFQQLRNARRLVKRLESLGFRAEIIGKYKDLYTVAYSRFTSRQQAENALILAQKDNSKAWVLKY